MEGGKRLQTFPAGFTGAGQRGKTPQEAETMSAPEKTSIVKELKEAKARASAAEKETAELRRRLFTASAAKAAAAKPKTVGEQMAAITDPAARNAFYRAHKAELKAEARGGGAL